MTRNTVAKYLKEMRENHILMGPYLSLNPALDYGEYVYLLNFSDPFLVVKWLKGFPHILQTAASLGDWNTFIVSDAPLDFSRITGFEKVIYQEKKGFTFASKAAHTGWDDALTKVYEKMGEKPPEEEPKKKVLLAWNEHHWKLFRTFQYDARKKVTSKLKKIKVQYDTYTEWLKTLKDHCTIQTEFYPGGYYTYMTYCFLFFTEYRQSVKSLFSQLPTTPLIIETGENLLVFASVPHDLTQTFISSVYEMRKTGIVDYFKSAVLLTGLHSF